MNILTKYTPLKDPALYDRLAWDFINPDCVVRVPEAQADVDWFVEHGYMTGKPDMAKVIDASFCQAAMATLGRYQP